MILLTLIRRCRTIAFAWRLRLHAFAVGARISAHIHPTARLRGRIHVYVSSGSRTRVEMGPEVVLERGTLLHFAGGRLSVGERTQIRAGCVLRVRSGTLTFEGQNVLSYYATVHCDERVHIGLMTIIGEHVTIADSNHVRPNDPSESLLHNVDVSSVQIGARGWIGTKATITAGTTIGDDVMVAANAVVVSDLPDGVTAGGVPARVLTGSG